MSITKIKYLYEQGVYSIKELENLVLEKEISKQDFFLITRFVYSEKER